MRTLLVLSALLALCLADRATALVFAVLALAYDRPTIPLAVRLRAALDRERERRATDRSDATGYTLHDPPIDR